MLLIWKNGVVATGLLIVLAGGPALSVAVGEPRPAPAPRPPLDVSAIAPIEAADADGVFAIRVGELFAAPNMAGLAEKVNQFLATQIKQVGIPINLPVRVQDIEQISGSLQFRIDPDRPPPNQSFMAALHSVRMKEPCDWVAIVKKQVPDVKVIRHGGVTYLETELRLPTANVANSVCLAVPDDRTIIVFCLDSASSWIDRAEKGRIARPWDADWKEVEGGLAALAVGDPTRRFSDKLARVPPPPDLSPDEKEWEALGRVVFRRASHLVAGLNADGALRVGIRMRCDSTEAAVELEAACAARLKAVREKVQAIQQVKAGPDAPAAARLVAALVSGASVRRSDKQVHFSTEAKGYDLNGLVELLGPGGGSAPAPATEEGPRRMHTLELPGLLFTPPTLSSVTRTVVTCSGSSPGGEAEVRVWDAKTGERIAGPLTGEGVGQSHAIRFDRRVLLTGGANGYARLWELPSGRPIGPAFACFADASERTVERVGPTEVISGPRVEQVAFSPTGSAMAAVSVTPDADPKKPARCVIRHWDVSSGRPVGGEPKPWPDPASPLLFTFNGELVFPSATAPLPTHELKRIFAEDRSARGEKSLWCSALSLDGTRALTGDVKGRLTLWDLASGKPIGEPLVFGPEQRRALARLLLQDSPSTPAAEAEQQVAACPPIMVTAVALSPDGRQAATATTFEGAMIAPHVWVWDLEKRQVVAGPFSVTRAEDKKDGSATVLRFCPDGATLAVGVSRRGEGQSLTGEVQIWDLGVGKRPRAMIAPSREKPASPPR